MPARGCQEARMLDRCIKNADGHVRLVYIPYLGSYSVNVGET
jgi:hypothetical protein